MNERKWTKGDWKVTLNPGVAYLPPSFIVVGPALVAKYTGYEDIAEANAHLISASPDLYEALEEATMGSERHLNDPTISEALKGSIRKCLAALAKARGEA